MNNDLFFGSETNEHYTPYSFLLKVCEFYGGCIDLDPCANSLIAPHCPAAMHYTIEQDGLTLPWFGNVFVNPPYGRDGLPAFVKKCIAELEASRVNQILLLVPSRTDTKWHRSLNDFARCYLTGRLKFHNPANAGNAAPFPSVLFYFGQESKAFQRYWQSAGEVFMPLSNAESEAKERRKEYMKELMRKRRAQQKN